MRVKSGGLAALLDRGVVTQCPLCDTDNPDLENHGFCSACGALFRDKIHKRLTFVKGVLGVGVLLTIAGAATTLVSEHYWVGRVVFALGSLPLAFGILANRQLAGFLLEAFRIRAANDTLRSLRETDRVAVSLLVFFVPVLIGCLPYYLYVEQPRRESKYLNVELPKQQLAEYQGRFQSELEKYVSLVPADEKVPLGNQSQLVGKAVVVERSASGPQVSAAHLALLADIRAESPAEVNSVVVVEWENDDVGPYPDTTQPAYRVTGVVQVVDPATKTVLARTELRGGNPPEYPPRDGSAGYGPKPDIAKYVNGLPKIPAPETEPPVYTAPKNAAESAVPEPKVKK